MQNGNDRVTVAVLDNQVKHLAKRIDEKVGGLDTKIDRLTDKVEKGLDRSAEVEKCIVELKTNYDNLDEKVDDMKDKNKLANVGIMVGEVFIGVMAALGIRQ